ncbi:hypothetical protein [Paenibacillus sp. FSL H3-0319]|uniref:hypothetical protein n=1 Tax=Paenibacillus sp. FSL H3-0319 TaxID=2954733 RepID=UPI0030F7F94E
MWKRGMACSVADWKDVISPESSKQRVKSDYNVTGARKHRKCAEYLQITALVSESARAGENRPFLKWLLITSILPRGDFL